MFFIIFVMIVVGFLFLLPGKQYAPIPDDGLHKAAGDVAACMKCHGPGKKNELKKTHPPKYECFKCHKRGKS
jgi:hypothetical protein